jgi:isocitrate dehydrogenase (NAD+)
MQYAVTLIPGDSVGREVAAATQRLIAAAGVNIAWDHVEAGMRADELTGDPMPAHAVDSIRQDQVALKGRIATPIGAGYERPNTSLCKSLGLFDAVRLVRSQEGL